VRRVIVPILNILSPSASVFTRPFPEKAKRSIRAAWRPPLAGARALISASPETRSHCPTPALIR